MPQQHYFYNIMRKTIIQFLDIFNDIVIARYDKDTGATLKYVKVPLKFAPKTKQWYWTELKEAGDNRDIVLPMMAIHMDNVEYSVDRQVNRNSRVSISNDGTTVKRYYNPVPYDYLFNLQIAAEYIIDITQIIEQILPFFTPEAYIRVTVPELNITGLSDSDEAGADKLDLRVLYEGSQKEAPVELDEAGHRILLWNISFRVQGYLFSPIDSSKTVHKVIQNYYATDEAQANASLDIAYSEHGKVGYQSVQGVTSATNIPTEGSGVVDDDVRLLYEYEEFFNYNDYVRDADDEFVLDESGGNIR